MQQEKERYERAELEIVRFEAADVITGSYGENDLPGDYNK